MTDTEPKEVSQEEERSLWEINPYKVRIELSQGNIRMEEQALHNGRVRVSEALDITNGPPECAWVYIHAESRDGVDLKLTPTQARDLRDALDTCIQSHEEDNNAE